MNKARDIRSQGTVERQHEAMQRLLTPGDCVMVVRGMPRSLVIRCPDGCGDVLTVNLDHRVGPAWHIYEQSGRLTVYPSVWRENGCRAHFIIWRNRILWCDGKDNGRVRLDDALIGNVRNALRDSYDPYTEIGKRASVIPWEALWACQTLAERGEAIAGRDQTFRSARRERGGGILRRLFGR